MKSILSANKGWGILTVTVVCLAIILVNHPRLLAQTGVDPNASAAAATPLLTYQARLLDPTTGDPKPDGVYSVSFRLYNVETGGTALWQEIKDITVADGLLTTHLGDTTALNTNHFNGQALWLGIKVGADAEAVPRQLLTFSGYTLYTLNADKVDDRHATSFADAIHTHAGTDITSGLVAQTYIDGAIARDSEVTSAISTHTGNASAHHSRYTDTEAWAAVLANDGPGSTLNADLLDGQSSAAFATAAHTHDDRYYTETEATSLFVNANGDTMTGNLTVPKIIYSTPRTHYYVLGASAFVPGSNVDYTNTYGVGGAYIASGSGALVAPVNLPDGCTVTSFRVYFQDDSASDMTVSLYREYFSGSFNPISTLDSSGITGYGNKTATLSTTINNTTSSYLIYAYSTGWSSSLRIKGVVIGYTLSEAQ